MKAGEERRGTAGLTVRAADVRARSAAAAAHAAAAARSAEALRDRADRMIGRVAERNPEYAHRMQVILVTAACQRVVIAESNRRGAAVRPGAQAAASSQPAASSRPAPRDLPAASGRPTLSDRAESVIGLVTRLGDMAADPERYEADGRLQDEIVQGIFAAGLLMQDAADATTEAKVRWLIEAAAECLDELVRLVRDAQFKPADGISDREPGGDLAAPAW